MSADLFAAFGAGVPPQNTSNVPQDQTSGLATPSNMLIPGIEALDIEHQHNLDSKPSRPENDEGPLWHRDERGTDVLFDATEDVFEADEEFGDFEDANATGHNTAASAVGIVPKRGSMSCIVGQVSSPTHDLLGLHQEDANTIGSAIIPHPRATPVDTISPPNAQTKASTTSAEEDWGDFSAPVTDEVASPAKGTNTTPKQVASQVTEPEQNSTEDDWDAFEDGLPEESTRAQTKGPPSNPADAPIAGMPPLQPPPKPNAACLRTHAQTAEDIRPTNIPPPAILLQLLPGIFHDLRQNTTHQAEKNVEQTVNPPSRDLSLTIIQTFTVAARIIAGRSLRWKRDAILSQNMRIGPAASAGRGRGMKLAAIDKSESLKEEKEAADVVGAWEKSAHWFNSTVSKAGIQRPLMALYLSVRPRVASGVDVLKAGHACALCGINRDERVSQVEVRVEDTFGEYWAEHWGHRDCRDFWTTHKDRLQQR